MHYVQAKGILSAGNGMNLYRGCTHGCIYCDSRSRCYRMDHAFEDIEVKENALTLLEDALRRKRSACMLGTGAMTDPYILLESELGYVRGALSLALRYGFGFTLQTKSDRVLRDIDLLQAINERTKCVVQMTLTTYDEALCRKLEPNVCTSAERFTALKKLCEAAPKFGNDDDYADLLARDASHIFCKEVVQYPCMRGGFYIPELHSVSTHVYFGELTGATPDGRPAATPFSDGASPVGTVPPPRSVR